MGSKNLMRTHLLLLIFLCLGALPLKAQTNVYQWLDSYALKDCIPMRIEVPEGFARVRVEPDGWQHWLRYLKLSPADTPIEYYNGDTKRNTKGHVAVVAIDVGKQDLQQCADAVMRLRAEYLFTKKMFGAIAFDFTSGDRAEYIHYAKGYRLKLAPKTFKVSWELKGEKNHSYKTFKDYMKMVFIYAGSASLALEIDPVKSVKDLQIGDVFIQGGFPGHAVIVLDIAEQAGTGNRKFLLAQSYMPAQSIHILVNPNSKSKSKDPWFELSDGQELKTPDWTFKSSDLKRFP